MTNAKRRPATIIAFPHPVAHPQLHGLRLKEGAMIALVVENDCEEEEMTVGLRFNRNGKERTVFFDDEIHVRWLPALSSPTCRVTVDLNDKEIGLYINADPLDLSITATLDTLTAFLEESNDSEPDDERFAGSAEQ
jgi:hypothetical protein